MRRKISDLLFILICAVLPLAMAYVIAQAPESRPAAALFDRDAESWRGYRYGETLRGIRR